MPLDEQSRRLTKFAIGNQQYEFNRLIYGIFIGPAAFSAFMSKIFRPFIFRRCFYASQTKDEMFIVLEKYHPILLHENMKAATIKSHFPHMKSKNSNHLQIKKIKEFLGMLNF